MARRRKRYLDNTAPADNTANVVRPVNRMIQVKRQDTPARRKEEQRKTREALERARVTPLNSRPQTFAPYRQKTNIDRAAGEVFAASEERRKQEETMKEAGAFLGDVADLAFSTVMPSTYVDMVDAYKRGKRDVWDVAGARFTDRDAWSKRNPGTALVTDIIGPAAIGKLGIIGRNIANRNLFAYEYLNPVGYQDGLSRGWTVAKHVLKDNRLPKTKLNESNAFWANVKDGEYIDSSKYRDVAYRKALNLGEPIPLYLPNGDGTFRYNLNFLKNHAQFDLIDGSIALPAPGMDKIAKLGDDGIVYGSGIDRFTVNGGRVSIDDDVTNSIRTMYDNWEAKWLSHYLEKKGEGSPYKTNLVKFLGGDNSKLVRKLRGLDMLPLLGGKSFKLRTTYPYTNGVAEDLAGKLLGRKGASTRLESIVDFNRLNSEGLIVR